MTQAYTLSRWSLSDLFPAHDSPEMNAALERLDAMATEIEAFRPRLSPEISNTEFMEIVRKMEEVNHLGNRVFGFANLKFLADTQDQTAQAFVARVDQLFAILQNRTLFFNLWWKELEDSAAERLMADSGDYRYWLEEMRHYKPHTLSEPEEKIINIKDVTGVKALNNLYDSITNRYTFKMEVDGRVEELTREGLMVYVRKSDPSLRARAYQEMYRVYGQDGPILGQMYQTLVWDWRNENIDMRRFANPISTRNLANDIPDQVVATLLEVCERNAPLFQRYFRLKAKWLGVERLRRYDIYAPVVEADKTYEYPQAVDLVLGSFRNFAPRVAELAQRVLERNHVDSEGRKGKRGGAFCWSVAPNLAPWVLVNYQGRADDIATLAHELGHAIHSQLAADHSIFTFHASLPLAETASTFGEMLVVEDLLAREQDEAVRRDVLFRQVDDAYATITRQAFFAIFEQKAHEMVVQGASVDQLSAAYLENLKTQFGDAIELSDEFKWEWVSIPHIYQTPFYVYAYAFGQLLVFSLFQQFKAEGEPFKARYLKILAAGASEAPAKILSEAGVDIYSPAFWQGGFDVIEGMIKELEALPVVR